MWFVLISMQIISIKISTIHADCGLVTEKYTDGYFDDVLTWFDGKSPANTTTLTSISLGDEGSSYSYRISGTFTAPESTTYSFSTTSDDSSTVYINGTLVVDNSGSHPAITVVGTFDATAGESYPIILYYGENSGGAEFDFQWKGGSVVTAFVNDLTAINPPGCCVCVFMATACTCDPTKSPTDHPTNNPTKSPTDHPTSNPTTNEPSLNPTTDPTKDPSVNPTTDPTTHPTTDPTFEPTVNPTQQTSNPTHNPTSEPTQEPTTEPTHEPTTTEPTTQPTVEPTINPTTVPTIEPTTDEFDTTESNSVVKDQQGMFGILQGQYMVFAIAGAGVCCCILVAILAYKCRTKRVKLYKPQDLDSEVVMSVISKKNTLQSNSSQIVSQGSLFAAPNVDEGFQKTLTQIYGEDGGEELPPGTIPEINNEDVFAAAVAVAAQKKIVRATSMSEYETPMGEDPAPGFGPGMMSPKPMAAPAPAPAPAPVPQSAPPPVSVAPAAIPQSVAPPPIHSSVAPAPIPSSVKPAPIPVSVVPAPPHLSIVPPIPSSVVPATPPPALAPNQMMKSPMMSAHGGNRIDQGMINVEDKNTGQCVDCGQMKKGQIFETDGLFYCHGCWRKY